MQIDAGLQVHNVIFFANSGWKFSIEVSTAVISPTPQSLWAPCAICFCKIPMWRNLSRKLFLKQAKKSASNEGAAMEPIYVLTRSAGSTFGQWSVSEACSNVSAERIKNTVAPLLSLVSVVIQGQVWNTYRAMRKVY